jgi:hypothetical protein
MRFLLATLVVAATVTNTAAQDWTQWRGPSRDGAIPAALIPTPWPAGV